MKITYYTLWIVILYLLQSTIFNFLKIGGVKPETLLVFVVTIALLKGSVEGGSIGLVCGLLTDILGGRTLGMNALLMMYTGVLCGLFYKRFYRSRYIIVVVFVLLSTLMYELLFYGLNFGIWGENRIVFAFFATILPTSVYTAVVSIPLYFLIRRTFRRISDLDTI